MAIETSTVTLPAYWASALVNGDTSSFSLNDDGGAEELAAMNTQIDALASAGWRVVDVCRDEDGDAQDPRFTWSYAVHGGTASGGDVLDYVILRERPA